MSVAVLTTAVDRLAAAHDAAERSIDRHTRALMDEATLSTVDLIFGSAASAIAQIRQALALVGSRVPPASAIAECIAACEACRRQLETVTAIARDIASRNPLATAAEA